MNPYNGFSEAERNAAWVIQKKAIVNKTLVQMPCEMCSQGLGMLMPHLEDYTRPLSAYHWLCVECHMSLHGRFSNPVRWVKLLLKLRDGYKAPIYSNVMTFFSRSGIDNSKMPDFIPDTTRWQERLNITEKIDFRELSTAEQDYIR